MYKKTKLRIVLTIMGILTFLFIATLSAIYISSYVSVHQKNAAMLNIYTDAYWKNGSPEGNLEHLPPLFKQSKSDDLRFRTSLFYAVAFDSQGQVITVDNEMTAYIEDRYFIDLGRRLIEKGKPFGTEDQWMYQIETYNGVTLVVFKNNEIIDEEMTTLLHNMMFFGFIAIVAMTFPSYHLAHHIILPLEISHLKQKQFISDASHELKTPLTVIHTNVEMLETEIGENKWLHYIKYEARVMNQLVNQMLELARFEQLKTELFPLNFSRLVEGSVLPFESVAFEKGKQIQMDIKDNLSVLGNAGQLANLVSILLDNALEYAPENSTVTIDLQTERHLVVLNLQNELENPMPSDLNPLFDRFHRLDASRASNGHFGLGLAIAKAIVTAHQGKITAYSKGQRVYFTVELPKVTRDSAL